MGTTAAAFVAGWSLGAPINLAMAGNVLLGEAIGLLLTPDIDQIGRTREENRFGPLRPVWQVMWYPYALAFKHRGVSHWPIVGTATRAAYLYGWIVLVAWLLGHTSMVWPPPPVDTAMAQIAAGWVLVDVLHWLTDWVS